MQAIFLGAVQQKRLSFFSTRICWRSY